MLVKKLDNSFGMFIAVCNINGRDVYGYGFNHITAIASALKNIW